MNGAAKSTQQLIEALCKLGVEGMTLLDIGGGVGAIQHALLAAGVNHATHIDASSAYVHAAIEEAKRLNLDRQIDIHYGDFVQLALQIPPADIVTLDRVVCCYDDMPALVRLSAERADRVYALVFPRDAWLIRTLMPIANFLLSLSGTKFRIFVHRTQEIDQILRAQGLENSYHQNSGFWQIRVYSRVS